MAYPRSFVKFSVGGSVAGEDVWTNGLTFDAGTSGANGALFTALDPESFKTVVQTFYTGTTVSMCPFNTLQWIKIALIGEDGKYIVDAKIYDYPAPVAGSGTAIASPHDTIVVSLDSGAKRGLAKRGRIYLPGGFAAPSAATGRITNTSVDVVLNKAVIYLDAVEAIMKVSSATTNLVVASSVRAGQMNVVLNAEVGNLVDNQSRRRNRLQEVYNTAALA